MEVYALYFRHIFCQTEIQTHACQVNNLFNVFNLFFVSVSVSFEEFMFFICSCCYCCGVPIHFQSALLHGLHPSPPHFIPLPPSTLRNSSPAPCSSSFLQELAASTFWAIKCSWLKLAWELEIWRNAVVGTKCLQYFSGVPLHLESVQLLNPAVVKYLMI